MLYGSCDGILYFCFVNYYLLFKFEGGFVKCSELLRILRRGGWVEISQRGSHVKFKHPHKLTIIVVPNHGSKEIATGTLQRIIKDSGITLNNK
jgi:predicted RNA binding protein YcfA (HicA-like mRNA interferase family)